MPLQVPQLDDRSAEQLFAEARARIPVYTPEWTNFNDSDPGLTLVQLFAFMTENLLYRSNRLPEASRRKFLSLLGIGLQPASPGQGLVVFRNERGPVQPWPLEAGAELRAGNVPFRTRNGLCILPVTAEVFYKKPQRDLDQDTIERYKLVYETLLERELDELEYYKPTRLEPPQIGKPLPVVDLFNSATDTIDQALWMALVGPKNVDLRLVRAALANQTLTLGFYPPPQCQGRALRPLTWNSQPVADPGLVFEIAAPDPDPADPTGLFGTGEAKYAQLPVEYAENVLEAPGIVRVQLPPYEKLLLWDYDPVEDGTEYYPPRVEDNQLALRIATWIRLRPNKTAGNSGATSQGQSANRPQQQVRLSWVGINAARVTQAMPVTNERIGTGTGLPDQIVKVANTPVIVETSQGVEPGAPSENNFVLEIQDSTGAWIKWVQVEDLYAASPQSQVFSLDPESGLVSFGSGLRGMRPSLGAAIRVSYEYGGGIEGRVTLGAINKSSLLPGGFKVENPVPTWGADSGETIAEGERNIARYLRHRDRLVTLSDFRDLAFRTPGVDMGRVEVLPLFNPELFKKTEPGQTWPGTVTVLVIPKFDPGQPDAPRPDSLFLKAVCDWLDPRRLVTTEVFVRGPDYLPLWISVSIETMPGQLKETVRANVQTALKEYLSPLVGGPPVTAAANSNPDCLEELNAASEACPKLGGTGWGLGVDVRRQDLEAVATRVPGVRYINSIRFGVVKTGEPTLTDLESVPMVGLELPRVAGISVKVGQPADDLSTILGLQSDAELDPEKAIGRRKPVPVLPKKC